MVEFGGRRYLLSARYLTKLSLNPKNKVFMKFT